MKPFFGLMGSNRNGKARLYSGFHPRIPLIEVFSPQTLVNGTNPTVRLTGLAVTAIGVVLAALKATVWMPILLVDLLSLISLSRPSELHDWVLVRPSTATGRAFRLPWLRTAINRHVFERVEH